MSAVGRWGGFFCYVCANWLLLLLHNVPSRRRRPSVCLSLLFAHLVDYATATSKREREKRKGVRRGAAAAQMEKGKKGKKRVRK